MRPYRGRRPGDIRTPIVEPFWSGTRVIAHFSQAAMGDPSASGGTFPGTQLRLIEELGADVAPELPSLAEALVRAVTASRCVIDGVISRQVALTGVGASPIAEMRHRPALITRSRTELDVLPRGSAAQAGEVVDGFVALDLLSLDGTLLLDVPLLERKRLLESVVEPGTLVRTSPIVQPPVDAWVATWKSVGLRGGMLKAANSRYLPGTETTEWRIVERLGGRR
jgi:ATP-dependent DNA ligase